MPLLDESGILCVAAGVPAASLNILFVTRPLADPARGISGGIAFFDELGVPFELHIREGVDPAAEGEAVERGLLYTRNAPGMAMQVGSVPGRPHGTRIERVGAERLGDFQRVMADGFGMPVEIAAAIIRGSTLEADGVECYLGSVDGTAVATSTLVRTGRTAGVYNVATIESHRRRGLGEAMTWHAVREGMHAGCDVSILQASEMGRPIYERMGYRHVAPYRVYQRPGS
jgi:hypothetical protein